MDGPSDGASSLVSSGPGLIPVAVALSHLPSSTSYTATPLSGGLTNDNVLLTPADSSLTSTSAHEEKKLVLRRFDLSTTQALSISRRDEVRNARIAHAKGVAPELVLDLEATTSHGGGIIVSFVPGLTLDNEALAKLCLDDKGVGLVARTLRRLHEGRDRHEEESHFKNEWDPKKMRDGYISWCRESGVKLPEEYERLCQDPLLVKVYSVLQEESPEALVDAHNDLLAANFILTSSAATGAGGTESLTTLLAAPDAEIRLIDFELSGRAPPSWDLGAMASECQLPGEALERLLRAYWAVGVQGQGSVEVQEPSTFDTRRRQAKLTATLEGKAARVKLWSLVAKLTWTPWAFVVGHVKARRRGGETGEEEETFDYEAWALDRLGAAAQALRDGDEIERLVDAVRREPRG